MNTDKGMLVIGGLGLSPWTHTPLGVINAAKIADSIILEIYTSRPVDSTIEDVSNILHVNKKKIHIATRDDIEGNDNIVLNTLAEGKTVLFLTFGDPMVATTHQEMRLKAIKKGHKVEIIHSATVLNAVPSVLGLEHYRFGRVATISKPYGEYFPLTPYHIIAENRSLGLHTLILLDIVIEENYLMTANEALEILLEMETRVGKGIILKDTLLCCVARCGARDMRIIANTISTLIEEDFGPPPHTLVLPGRLHFVEAEALLTIANAPRELVEPFL